jgi:hypothetical protein
MELLAMTITVDDLAQEIRRVDGEHKLGAGALAEALMPFLALRQSSPPDGQTADGWIEWTPDFDVARRPDIDRDAVVMVKFRCGETETGAARKFDWWTSEKHGPGTFDIIAYRIIPTPSSETKARHPQGLRLMRT